MTELGVLRIPPTLNYIAAFLTFDCNLNCSYCINDPIQRGDRRTVFMVESGKPRTELTPDEWATILSRLPARNDLPVTFQGGEPLMYWKGEGLSLILHGCDVYADLLTNFALPPEKFGARFAGLHKRFSRGAAYPSIRVSYHAEQMKGDFRGLVDKCAAVSQYFFTVNPDPYISDIGIYYVDHPENTLAQDERDYCQQRMPLFIKDFLGVHNGELYGQYAYPFSTDLIARRIHPTTLNCECRTTELLIDPLGFVWGCHYYLYNAWERKKPQEWFPQLEKTRFDFGAVKWSGIAPIGHMLDPAFKLTEIEKFRPCSHYGKCVGCDTKFKKDRFSTEGQYRTSVIIRNIEWPDTLRAKSVILRSPSAMHTVKR